MELKALDVFQHLPKTDCQKCGQSTCLAFASELAQRQADMEACPDISTDARRLLARLMEAEQEMVSSAAGAMRTLELKGFLSLFYQAFIVMPLRAIGFLLFTFPWSLPVWFFIAWLIMR